MVSLTSSSFGVGTSYGLRGVDSEGLRAPGRHAFEDPTHGSQVEETLLNCFYGGGLKDHGKTL